jgi:glyoxylase-like metal-dependent hydrolase (beta-lactamase superfamily II)
MATLIDTRHMGIDRVIGAWLTGETGDLIVDPGPGSTLETLLGGLGETEPRAVLLTHIHLDHAAATGLLCRRFPGLRVYVHESGAPHVADPARLLASAARLYGAENMETLWGDVLPVERERITSLRGGETVEGMYVLPTPGHAAHHVAYFDPDDGAAYVGDVAGVRIPPGEVTLMPTPPPEIDVEAWQRSLAAVGELGARCLRLTHFGEVAEAEAQLAAAAEMLARQAELARAGDRDRFMAGLGEWMAEQPAEPADRMRTAMPPEQVWLGLERYWRKRGG